MPQINYTFNPGDNAWIIANDSSVVYVAVTTFDAVASLDSENAVVTTTHYNVTAATPPGSPPEYALAGKIFYNVTQSDIFATAEDAVTELHLRLTGTSLP